MLTGVGCGPAVSEPALRLYPRGHCRLQALPGKFALVFQGVHMETFAKAVMTSTAASAVPLMSSLPGGRAKSAGSWETRLLFCILSSLCNLLTAAGKSGVAYRAVEPPSKAEMHSGGRLSHCRRGIKSWRGRKVQTLGTSLGYLKLLNSDEELNLNLT